VKTNGAKRMKVIATTATRMTASYRRPVILESNVNAK
jgi:hypothetical protein